MNKIEDERGAFTVSEFRARYKISQAKFYEEAGSGRLQVRKIGSKTVILYSDALAWERSLPVGIKPAA
jgi:hypothetical protein